MSTATSRTFAWLMNLLDGGGGRAPRGCPRDGPASAGTQSAGTSVCSAASPTPETAGHTHHHSLLWGRNGSTGGASSAGRGTHHGRPAHLHRKAAHGQHAVQQNACGKMKIRTRALTRITQPYRRTHMYTNSHTHTSRNHTDTHMYTQVPAHTHTYISHSHTQMYTHVTQHILTPLIHASYNYMQMSSHSHVSHITHTCTLTHVHSNAHLCVVTRGHSTHVYTNMHVHARHIYECAVALTHTLTFTYLHIHILGYFHTCTLTQMHAHTGAHTRTLLSLGQPWAPGEGLHTVGLHIWVPPTALQVPAWFSQSPASAAHFLIWKVALGPSPSLWATSGLCYWPTTGPSGRPRRTSP